VPTVGYATLQVIPSVRGISDELRRQLVGPAADAGQDAGEGAGGGFRDAFTGALAALGVAEIASKIGEQFTEAFNQAMEQSSIPGTLKAQLGATTRDAARYGKVAGQLYSKGIVEDVAAGAEAVRATVQGGLLPTGATTKQIRTLSAEMADFATTFGTDLNLQSQAVAAQLKNGLAPNAQAALDVLTVGMQKLGPNAEDLLETFQEYPVQLRKLGLDSKTALGLFRQGIQGGARDTDIIADSLKEFSIRSIDMSAGSQAAYKALGLDAGKMSLQIAKGGKGASDGLQLVLDKLRGIKDPVKQAQVATGLFGTQAEDTGKALLALDPSKAKKTFGDVSGAAKQLGKDLHSGPAHEITVFQRGLRQAVVNVIGGQVLPVLARVGGTLNRTVLPPLTTVATVVGGVLIGALRGLWSAGTAVVGWIREWGIWLAPLAVLIGGVTLALSAQAIVEGAVIGIMAAYSLATQGVTLVTEGWAAAQALLNSIMALNPFVLVAIAVVALGVALVVAYKKSETFRNIVMAAWQGIQTATLWAWNNALKPALDGFMVGLRAVGQWATWLWSSVLAPTFSFITTAGKILATVFAVIVFGPLYLGFKVLGAVAMWLWSAVLSPVIGWIIGGFKLWWAGVQLYFGLVKAGFRLVGSAAVWLWKSAISPVIGWIVSGFKLWWAGVQLYFGLVKTGFRAVGSAATWLWKSAISPALNGARSVISTVYNTGIKPVIGAFKSLIHGLGGAFADAVGAIKRQWDRVKAIAKAPVQYVVDIVYNRGIVGVWNKVAGVFGAPKLSAFHFATGGVLPGYTPGRDVHLAALSGGEAVMRPEWTRAVGPGYVNAMNAAARSGGVGAIRRMVSGGMPAFADGGIFGWVRSAASKGVDLAKSGVSWLKDGLKASALAGLNKIVKPLISRISGSASLYRDMITGIPKRMIKDILGYSDTADKKLSAAGIGGKGYKSALSWARTQNGKPYQWGGNGNPSWDCSGFMSAIESVIRGQKPHRRWATGAFSGATAPPGWVHGARSPFMIGITNAGVGHTAGTINGVNVESRGGDGVVVGSGARSYRSSLFTDIYGFKGYADGGSPRPGEIAWVGENGPELIRFSGGEVVYSNAQSQQIAAGLGQLRGFKKGTSSASARKQIPGDLTSVSKALTASAADIRKAFAELTKDLTAAGGSVKALVSSALAASTKLQGLAKKRDAVDAKIAAAKQTSVDQKKTAADFLGLSNLSDSTSAAQIITGLQDRQATAKAFQSTIANLSKRGLSQDLIGQLVAMGPDSALAGVVAGASKAQIAQLNVLAKSGAKLSTSYGRTMADAMFDAGSNASKGFLTGLTSQKKELQAAMDDLADALLSSIKKKLKIKSPSRVTAWVGEMTGAGVGVGLDNTASDVAAAAARVADAAVPEVPAVSPASYTTAAAGAGGTLSAGSRLWLVLEDGRELAAYVDDRADGRVTAGLRQVRRKVAATAK
jgi:hypothetical protein